MLKIEENVPIRNLVTMRIGGPARFVITVTSKEEIPEAYQFAKERNLPVCVLGGGANTFVKDEGFDGIIILDRIMGISRVENPEVESSEDESSEGENSEDKRSEGKSSEGGDIAYFKAYGGEQWDDLVTYVSERGYSGIEAMTGIPGTAGAAPVQNIGAYGQEVTQVIVSVDAYDTKTGEFVV
ncbi:MAG: FAD-binding protein, partial [Mogibacterium diversum]|nr:FAD-binding protein [Mogibacterium diversum]